MKRALLVLVCPLLLSACASLRKPVACAGHVVVPAAGFHDTYAYWQLRFDPTADEIAACERALAWKLWRNGRRLADYCLRMEGRIEGGERRIIGKAGFNGRGGESYLTHPESDAIQLDTFGGGEDFFHFDYNCGKAKLVEFMFNADL